MGRLQERRTAKVLRSRTFGWVIAQRNSCLALASLLLSMHRVRNTQLHSGGMHAYRNSQVVQ